jgi:hypothetical protein|tara:strand:- start:13042 stop:13254 length:213 start_codon:yes stop_codon:yes gene_type:complete
MKRKIIIINEEDQRVVNKIKDFFRKVFLISLFFIITAAIFYVTIIVSVFVFGFIIIFGIIGYLYLKVVQK